LNLFMGASFSGSIPVNNKEQNDKEDPYEKSTFIGFGGVIRERDDF